MNVIKLFVFAMIIAVVTVQAAGTAVLNQDSLASAYCGNDKQWYKDNIPFFDCSNPQIKQVYYYRWVLYKSHLRNLGAYGYIVTEFLNNMTWDIDPYSSLNDATADHIYEGRWIKNKRYLDDYINYMYQHGGNDRHFSEGIADAAYNRYVVNMDSAFIARQLTSMKTIYTAWNDHRDAAKALYYVEPLLDAEEYTIASIDASNGTDGFTGGTSFRPSINSYMYANALAISKLATLTGDAATAATYLNNATVIKNNIQTSLWNTSFNHFVDRYQVSNTYVTYWNYIRGRELVGYVPWQFNIPDNNATFAAAWQHLMDTTGFMGKFGLRTLEPSYQYYMKQYRYDAATGKRECQWNGPSWPFLTTQVLDAMANLLNNYTQSYVTAGDYMKILKKYTAQHYYTGGILNIVEDYNADTGSCIVDLPERSQHYNHSQYNNLIITGLCGLRPRTDNTLEVNPLLPAAGDSNALSYFCLENVPYHGHSITILYDAAGTRYGLGTGLSIFVDGTKVAGPVAPGKQTIAIGAPFATATASPVNLAVNMAGTGSPTPTASYTNAKGSLYQAIDGRIWYWSNTINRWLCQGSSNASDWYSVNFGSSKTFNTVRLYFYTNDTLLQAPASYNIQLYNGTAWVDIPAQVKSPATPLGNTVNTVTFAPVTTAQVRAVFTSKGLGFCTALTEMEVTSEPVTATSYHVAENIRTYAAPDVRMIAHRLTIQRDALDKSTASIKLFSVNGTMVYATTSNQSMVKCPALTPGMYVVSIINNGQKFVRPVAVTQ